MELKMKMPDLSTNEGSEIAVTKWLVEVGQPVKRGQPLLEVETDKAVQEVECIANGRLKAVHAQAGESVAVGEIIAVIETG
jgi:pyruvate dehydrogenase E2 component (dihydrolipoamide acetyltransferase)